MNVRPGVLGLFALASLLSCGKEGDGVADVLRVSTVEVAPSSGTIVLGGTAQLIATPKTASGINIPGRNIVWSSLNEAAVSVSPSGLITAHILGGPFTIRATVDGVVGEAQITVQPVPVHRITLDPGQAAVTVGEFVELTATTYSEQGAPLPGRLVSFESSAPTVAAVTSTGVVLGISQGGPVTITARSEGKSATATITVNPRPAARLGFIQQPGSSIAGQPITPAVRVAIQNDQGATITTATHAVTITLENNPGGATLSGTRTVNAVGGIATFANLSLDRAGTGYTVSAAATGLAGATSNAFNISAGAANQLAFTTAPPGTAASGVPLSPQPILQLRDGSGNPVPQGGVVVTASIASGTATLGGVLTATTNSSGTASFNSLTLSGTSGSTTLAFSAPGVTAITSGPISLGAGTAAALAMQTQPSPSGQSGVPLGTQPAVILKDAAGNEVHQAGVAITVSIETGPNGATLSGGTVVPTNGSGVAVWSGLAITGSAGSYTFRFSGSGLTPVFSNTIVLSAGAGSMLAITTQPSATAASGVPFPQQPVVQLRDGAGNPVALAGVMVSATIQSGGGSLGGTTTVATGANGAAAFTNLSITGTAGSRTLLFAAAGYVSAASQPIAVGAGPPTALSITTQPSAEAASGVPFDRQPVLQLRDASNNPVSQAGVLVTSSIASGGGTLGGTATVATDASGVATFTNLSITGVPGNRTLGFSAAGLTGATSSAILLGVAPGTTLAITTQPSATSVSGVPFATQPAVQLTNAAAENVAQSGIVVTAAIASGGGSLGGTVTATTDGTGLATFTDLSISGAAGDRTLSFSATGLTGATSNVIAITAAPSKLAITTMPTSARSGVLFTIAPVIQLQSADGGAVAQAGVPVTVSVASGPATLGGTLTVNTDASGRATFTGLSLSGLVGDHTLRFTAPELTEVVSGILDLDAGPAAQIVMLVEPDDQAASGETLSPQPRVRIADAFGNPVLTGVNSIEIRVSIASGPALASLGGDVTKNTAGSGANHGIATFTDIRISGLAGKYTLRFAATTSGWTGLTPAVSREITIQ